MSRHRCYMITTFKEPDFTNEKITYSIYQKESCPTTGKIHYQCYVELNNPVGMKKVKEIIQDPQAHIEKRIGSQKQAIEYCSKMDTRVDEPVESGERKHQGHRTDIDNALKSLQNGTCPLDVVTDYPYMLRYINYFSKYKTMWDMKNNKRNWCTEVNILWGEPGTGKTRQVHESYPDVYVVPEASSSQFFDGYEGQETVLFDDYDGEIKYTTLLKLCDRYPMMVNTKGGMTNWKPKRIFFTSNKHPKDWYYNVKWEAFERRITNCTEVAGNTRPPLPTI